MYFMLQTTLALLILKSCDIFVAEFNVIAA